jgi:uncharacterized phage infection (PIP) family protein YhgE
MKKLISSLKRIRIGQILTVCLAGLLIFVSTACGGSGDNMQARTQTSGQARQEVPSGLQDPVGVKQGKNPRPEVPEKAETNTFQKGGMNEFSDIDPRQGMDAANQKAKSLVNQAERNVTEKSVDNPEQYVENYRQGAPLGERLQNITKSVSGAAKGVTEDASKGTQQGLQNAKANTQDASKGAQRAAEDTSNFAQRKTGEAAKGVQRAAEDVPGQAGSS